MWYGFRGRAVAKAEPGRERSRLRGLLGGGDRRLLRASARCPERALRPTPKSGERGARRDGSPRRSRASDAARYRRGPATAHGDSATPSKRRSAPRSRRRPDVLRRLRRRTARRRSTLDAVGSGDDGHTTARSASTSDRARSPGPQRDSTAQTGIGRRPSVLTEVTDVLKVILDVYGGRGIAITASRSR